MPSNRKTIACLKHGQKYSFDYVNRLHSMVRRHCNYDFEFVCFTEKREDSLDKDIRVLDIEKYDDIDGWWYKTFLFNPQYELSGEVLFLDLDIIVFNNIDKFFEYEKGYFCISGGFKTGNENGMNSSCFRFEGGSHGFLYTDFMKDRHKIMKRLHGDQDWFQESIRDHAKWPGDWLRSYKWDMKKEQSSIENTSIAVFHGYPKPHQINDNTWIKENWR
jgi:hypothetical protein